MTYLRSGVSALALGAVLVAGLSSTAMAKDITTVGITVGSLGNPYFAATDKGIADKAKEITPGAKISVVSSDNDLNKQFTQIDNFIAAGAQVIMVNAADPLAIRKAEKAGIAVGAFDVTAEGADMALVQKISSVAFSDGEVEGRWSGGRVSGVRYAVCGPAF